MRPNRARRALVVAGLWAVTACGSEPTGALAVGVSVQALTDVQRFDVRIFGGAVRCDAVLADPALGRTTGVCEAARADVDTDCHLASVRISPTERRARATEVPIGTRAVFVLAIGSAETIRGKGCREGLEVREGKTAGVTVEVVP